MGRSPTSREWPTALSLRRRSLVILLALGIARGHQERISTSTSLALIHYIPSQPHHLSPAPLDFNSSSLGCRSSLAKVGDTPRVHFVTSE